MLTSPPMNNVQTTLLPAGGTTMVEFHLELPVSYVLVDHALSRLERGLVDLLVEGPDNPEVFNPVAGRQFHQTRILATIGDPEFPN